MIGFVIESAALIGLLFWTERRLRAETPAQRAERHARRAGIVDRLRKAGM